MTPASRPLAARAVARRRGAGGDHRRHGRGVRPSARLPIRSRRAVGSGRRRCDRSPRIFAAACMTAASHQRFSTSTRGPYAQRFRQRSAFCDSADAAPATHVVGGARLVDGGARPERSLLTLADAALLRPLPLRDPASLVVLLLQRDGELMHNFSYPDYRELREKSSVAGLTAYSQVDATIGGADGTTTLGGEVVAGDFFITLGVPMRIGRGADDRRRHAGCTAGCSGQRIAVARSTGERRSRRPDDAAQWPGRSRWSALPRRRFSGMQIGRSCDVLGTFGPVARFHR